MGVRSSQSRGPGLNETDGHLLEYFRQTFTGGGGGTNYVAPPGSGLTATGGIINDYSSGPVVYRSHIFTTSGTFDITALGDFGTTIEYLVVAGGGGGGNGNGGGGGGGGYRTNVTGDTSGGGASAEPPYTIATGAYTVTVGGGGIGAPPSGPGQSGSPSDFHPTPVSHPSPTFIRSIGGGAAGGGNNNGATGGSGGGGGGRAGSTNGGSGTANQGYDGGGGNHPNYGGGGGAGAGAVGGDAPGSGPGGAGGNGLRTSIVGSTYPIGTPGPGPTTGGWLAGGGNGTNDGAHGAQTGGAGGGATGRGAIGTVSTGGGGGGDAGTGVTGTGGSGIVVIRYQIASTATAKASGGAISFYSNKTIHTFTSTGTFVTPGSFSETCDYVVVGGGGGAFTGGGGAGGYRTGTTPIGSSVNYTITVGAGAGAKSPIGSPSSIGTIPIAIPGGGSSRSGPEGAAQPGASGGGGTQGGGGDPGASATGASYPGSIGATPSSGWGHAGATSQPADKTGGGGGGAGGAGNPNSTGGTGIQLPTTFRDPNGFKYDNHPDHPFRPSATAGYFVAGGGAGTVYTPFPQSDSPLGPTPYSSSYPGMGGVGGGGCRNPADPRVPVYGFNGMANTGGGAAGGTPVTPLGGARGGSGLVLIAYPS